MPFTPGGFDVVAQVDQGAIDAIIDVVVKQLELQGKTRFTHQVPTPLGPLSVDVELTGMSIPAIHSADLADRFRSNIVTTFEVEAEVTFTFMNPLRTERVGIRLKDLQASLPKSSAGAPVVSLEFQTIDVDVIGLGTVGQILNFLLDVAGLGMRTVLAAMGLKPIPVFPVGDALKELGLAFASHDDSPYLGTNQTETGLALAMDFEAANNAGSDIASVQDILDPAMNAGVVINERLVNQALSTVLLTNDFGLVKDLDAGGIRFRVTTVRAHFEPPRARDARIRLETTAAARIRSGKGGFLGRLFGGRRKVTITAYAGLGLEAGIAPAPPAPVPRLDFDLVVESITSAATGSVFATVLRILMAPLLLTLLLIFNEVLKLSFEELRKHVIDMRIDNGYLVATVTRFQAHLAAGHHTTLGLPGVGTSTFSVRIPDPSATLAAVLAATFSGYFELGHFTMEQLANSGVPMAVDYPPASLATRDEELFLGVGLRSL